MLCYNYTLLIIYPSRNNTEHNINTYVAFNNLSHITSVPNVAASPMTAFQKYCHIRIRHKIYQLFRGYMTVKPLLWGHPFAAEIWPFKKGGHLSGVEINTFISKFTLSSGLSKRKLGWDGSVVSMSSHAVGRGFALRSGHTNDHKNGTNFPPAWHAGIRIGVWECNLTL